MDYVINQAGVQLSNSQMAHLDTCPFVNCRLQLRQVSINGHGGGGGGAAFASKNAALSLVNQFRYVDFDLIIYK